MIARLPRWVNRVNCVFLDYRFKAEVKLSPG
jgi:hypothetical protein